MTDNPSTVNVYRAVPIRTAYDDRPSWVGPFVLVAALVAAFAFFGGWFNTARQDDRSDVAAAAQYWRSMKTPVAPPLTQILAAPLAGVPQTVAPPVAVPPDTGAYPPGVAFTNYGAFVADCNSRGGTITDAGGGRKHCHVAGSDG